MFDRNFVRILNFVFVVRPIARDVVKVGIGKGGMKDVKCSVSGMKKKRLKLASCIEGVRMQEKTKNQ